MKCCNKATGFRMMTTGRGKDSYFRGPKKPLTEAAFSQCGRSRGHGHWDRGGWCRTGKGSAGLGRQVRGRLLHPLQGKPPEHLLQDIVYSCFRKVTLATVHGGWGTGEERWGAISEHCEKLPRGVEWRRREASDAGCFAG